MAKKTHETSTAPEYVRWIHPEPRWVPGYGLLEPNSVHRVADLPGDPLQQLGVTFEAASAEVASAEDYGGTK